MKNTLPCSSFVAGTLFCGSILVEIPRLPYSDICFSSTKTIMDKDLSLPSRVITRQGNLHPSSSSYSYRDFSFEMTDAGIGKVDNKSLPTTFTILCFIAIALYNVAELFFIIFATFKKRRGLYFWSFLVSTCGIGLYSIGFLLKDMSLSSQSVFYVTLIVVGWSSMVTGQSIVLYSRLHLVLRKPAKLRLVLIMIICNAIICHVPIIGK